MDGITKIDTLQKKLKNACTSEAKKRVRMIFKRNKDIQEFYFNMGCWLFYDKNGNQIEDYDNKLFPELDFFMNEYYDYINPFEVKRHKGNQSEKIHKQR